jgi:protein subunit release factor A
MKTAKEIEKEILENTQKITRLNKDIDERIEVKRKKSQVKQLKKKNTLLKQLVLYLKTNPREEFIKQELSSVKQKIDSIENKFGEWYEGKEGKHKNPRSTFKTQMGIPILKEQEKTLKYLLS